MNRTAAGRIGTSTSSPVRSQIGSTAHDPSAAASSGVRPYRELTTLDERRVERECDREVIEDADPAAEERQIVEQLAGRRLLEAQHPADHRTTLVASRVSVAEATLNVIVRMQGSP